MCTLECLFSKDEESRSRFFPLRLPKGNLYFSIFVCVTVCVFYIRAAAAARDRAAAAVVGAWPNIWLRHHQTRYFFFSISLFENQREGEREKLVWWPAIPSTDIWYNDGRHWDSNHVEEVRLFSLPSPTLFFPLLFSQMRFFSRPIWPCFSNLFFPSLHLSPLRNVMRGECEMHILKSSLNTSGLPERISYSTVITQTILEAYAAKCRKRVFFDLLTICHHFMHIE